MTKKEIRERDRETNKLHDVVDIDDLRPKIATQLKLMLSNLGLQDVYSGDVFQMCRVVNQVIKDDRRLYKKLKTSIEKWNSQT